MLVDNNPKVPSRIKALLHGSGESPAPVLVSMARRLSDGEGDFLAIPCNTALHYLREVQKAVDIPVLDWMADNDFVQKELTP